MGASVTVLMTVYNGARHIADTIASIAAQTLVDHEFLIVDDASTDATPGLLAEAAKADSRIKVITLPTNGGPWKAANAGLEVARGQYIARTDSDDLSHPRRLELQARFLDSHPEHVLVGARERVTDLDGRFLREGRGELGALAMRYLAHFAPPLVHSAAMYRRSTLIENGLRYDESGWTAQDFEFWQRLQRYGKAARLPDCLLTLREHSGSISQARREEQQATAIGISVNSLKTAFPSADCDRLHELAGFIIAGKIAPHTPLDRLVDLCEELESGFFDDAGADRQTRSMIRGLTVNQLIKGAHRAGVQLEILRLLMLRRPAETAAEMLAIARRRRPTALQAAKAAA